MSTRLIDFQFRIKGADQVETSIKRVDDTADKADDSVKSLGSALDNSSNEADAAARAFLKAADAQNKLAEKSKDAARASEEHSDQTDRAESATKRFEERMGRLGAALGGFGALALPGAIMGIAELVKSTWEWTEAGKAALLAQEQHTAALQATIAKLVSLSDLTKAATSDLIGFYRATREMKRIEEELQPLLEKRIELETELEYRQNQLTSAMASGNAHIRNVGMAGVIRYTNRIADLDAKIANLTKTYQTNKSALHDVTSTLEMSGDVFKKVFGWYEKGAKSAKKAEKATRDWRNELALITTIDIDNLPRVSIGDIIDLDGGDFDPESLVNDLLSNNQQDDSFRRTREALARRNNAFAEANAAAMAAAADINPSALATIDAFNKALESEGAMAWRYWAKAAAESIGQIQDLMGSFTVAFDAVTDATLTSRNNDLVAAEDALRLAERAERIAESNLKADQDSVKLKKESKKASEQRLAAENAVYNAQVKQWKAEQEAAEAQKILKGIEFALEGAKAGAKAVESFALAAFLAALPFGAGAAFVPAAILAGTTYTAAAAAYGVGAVASFTAPTRASARPVAPEPAAPTGEDPFGARGGSGDREQVINVNLSDAVVVSEDNLADLITRLQNNSINRRGAVRDERRRR